MSEMKTPIKTINGHALVDTEARAGVEENGKTISRLTEEIDALTQSTGTKPQIVSGNLGAYDSSMLTSVADENNDLVFICGYNGEAGSCELSGNTIERITLEIMTAGTLIIGKCSLDNLGVSSPVITSTQTVTLTETGMVTFDITPIALGVNETIVIKHKDGTARFYGKGVAVENASEWQRAMRFCTAPQYRQNQLTYNIYAFGAFYKNVEKKSKSTLGVRSIGQKIASGEVKKILLLGDSITDGYGGTGYNGSQSTQISTNTAGYCWANALKKYLEETYSVAVDNYGAYGSNLNQQRTLFKDAVESGSYDLIIFLTGTNNRVSADSFTYYKNNLAGVIEWMKGYSEVFVMNGIPGRVDGEEKQPYGMEQIADVVVGVSDITDYYDNLYIRFVEYCEVHDLELTSDSTLFADFTHPNDAGYHVMFKLICSAMGITLSAHTDYTASGAWWAGE